MNQPIPEDSLWDKKENCPIVHALLQIYYLMSDWIIDSSNAMDRESIETLGPLAYVMVPIAYSINAKTTLYVK